MNIKRAYKFRFYPTDQQAQNLAETFGCARKVYNHFLDFNNTEYKNGNPTYFRDWSKSLTELKQELLYLKGVSSVVLQQSLRNLDSAFKNFFKGNAKFPKFKSKHNKNSIKYVKSGFNWDGENIKLAKQKEPLDIRWSRKFKGEPSSVTVSRTATGKYFISILVEEDVSTLPYTPNQIGIDVGIADFLTTSDGEKVSNPRFFVNNQDRLAQEQKKLARKVKGSNNRFKQKKVVATVHEHIVNARKDFLHKVSTTIINENQVICVESLNIKGMLKNSNLSKAISDVAWGSFISMLSYKANWYGRTLINIDRWFPSSKTCSCCGHKVDKLPLNIRKWQCESCGVEHDRDINAARNILKEGLAGTVSCVKSTTTSKDVLVSDVAKGINVLVDIGRKKSPTITGGLVEVGSTSNHPRGNDLL